MYLQQKNSNTTYSGVVQFFSYKQMLAREREQIKENILVTNEDERGGKSDFSPDNSWKYFSIPRIHPADPTHALEWFSIN
jgi:hypothetical protein